VDSLTVQFCYFEQVTPIDPNRLCTDGNDAANPNYIAGMDIMVLSNSVIKYNVFKNIRGATGGGRAAIFIWQRCDNVIAEKNIITGCDRAIGYGNSADPKVPWTYHMKDALIRNNFIVAGAGRAVELCNTNNTKVINNTIYNPRQTNQAWDQTIWCEQDTGVEIRNNIIMGNIHFHSGIQPVESNNISNATVLWFRNVREADLHLTAQGSAAIDAGMAMAEITYDIDGCERTGNPDVGADEVGCSTAVVRVRPVYDLVQPGPGIRVWPNPFSTSVDISILRQKAEVRRQKVEIGIYDITGKLLISNFSLLPSSFAPKARWSPKTSPNGIYIINAEIDGRKYTTRVLLRR
jgi:hypothetical protein